MSSRPGEWIPVWCWLPTLTRTVRWICGFMGLLREAGHVSRVIWRSAWVKIMRLWKNGLQVFFLHIRWRNWALCLPISMGTTFPISINVVVVTKFAKTSPCLRNSVRLIHGAVCSVLAKGRLVLMAIRNMPIIGRQNAMGHEFLKAMVMDRPWMRLLGMWTETACWISWVPTGRIRLMMRFPVITWRRVRKSLCPMSRKS